MNYDEIWYWGFTLKGVRWI